MSWANILPVVGSILGGMGGGGGGSSGTRPYDTITNQKADINENKSTQSNSTNNTNQTTAQSTANKGFSDPILNDIERMLSSMFGVQRQSGIQTLVDNRAEQVANKSDSFDIDSFVNNLAGSAAFTMESDREQSLNSLASKAGGGADGNSMLALLRNKMQNTDAASLAGIKTAATKEGTAIASGLAESKTGQLNQTAQTSNSLLVAMIQALAGQNGTTQTTGSQVSLSNELQKLFQNTSTGSSQHSNVDYMGI